MMEKKRCRHERNSWFFTQGGLSAIEWCYCCGAVRQLDRVNINGAFTAGKWQKPVGQDGKNPAMKG